MKSINIEKSKKVEIIIGINRQLLIFSSIMLLFGILYRNLSSFWLSETMNSSRINRNIFCMFTILYFITSATGLSLKKEWGRIFSISSNFLIFFIFLGVKIILGVHLLLVDGLEFSFLDLLETTDDKIQFFVSIVSIILLVVISRKKFKKEFLYANTRK